ncbi:hypothetical protein [Streptomyces sp. CL12]|uniref:hypothetical protein n=1 Tax=Streptomyces sp. CL12 TaxID=3391744 RepID=UPI003A7FFA3F
MEDQNVTFLIADQVISLQQMAADPNAAQSGVGSALLDEVRGLGRTADCRLPTADCRRMVTEVWDSDLPAAARGVDGARRSAVNAITSSTSVLHRSSRSPHGGSGRFAKNLVRNFAQSPAPHSPFGQPNTHSDRFIIAAVLPCRKRSHRVLVNHL